MLDLVSVTIQGYLLNASGHQHKNKSDDHESSEHDPQCLVSAGNRNVGNIRHDRASLHVQTHDVGRDGLERM